jgi:thiamine pyrophosphokinase
MNGICYIVGAGLIDEMTLEPTEHDYVIAADAGYLHLSDLSVAADLVVGDFDSLSKKPNHPNVVQYPAEKDQTDMLLAVTEGLRRGFRTFVILGGMGGRLDHTYANIQMLSYIASKNAHGYLLGGGTAVTVIRDGSIRFEAEKSGVVSVFCTGEAAHGVTIKGLKYPLTNAELNYMQSIGVSNEFTGAPSEISVLTGSLVIMWKDRATDVIESLRESNYAAV